MRIAIISGSHREHSQSEKVARYIAQALESEQENVASWLFSLAGNPLPLWDSTVWEKSADWNKRLEPIATELKNCDGLVVVTPEWHGQVPAGLKNFFLLVNKFQVGHKPALLVSVSSGEGGAYPIAELRMSSYKNNRICYLPEHLIVRKVESVLNQDPAANDASRDALYRERISWVLGLLKGYAQALKVMRETTSIHHDKFSNGM